MKGTDLMIKEAFQCLINSDLEWLMKQPKSPERDHIESVIKQMPDLLYERKESDERLFDEWTSRSWSGRKTTSATTSESSRSITSTTRKEK